MDFISKSYDDKEEHTVNDAMDDAEDAMVIVSLAMGRCHEEGNIDLELANDSILLNRLLEIMCTLNPKYCCKYFKTYLYPTLVN